MNDDDHELARQLGPRGMKALQEIRAAAEWVTAAKRTHSMTLIEHAQRELHAAVDAARDVDVQWGQIGTALGIARGNAYQRYRKRLSRDESQPNGHTASGYHYPAS